MAVDTALMSAVRCSLCGRASTPPLLGRSIRLSPVVVDELQATDPAWQRVLGACPVCVLAAVRRVLASDRRAELFAIEGPFPPLGAFPALPVGVRVHADPGPRGRGVTMALVDAGFHPHRHLTEPRNRILAHAHAMGGRAPGRTESRLVVPDDEPHRWHGSMTSGVAGGNGLLSNGLYPGLASESELVLVRVRGVNGRVGDPQITAGLRWVLNNLERYRIGVVSLSVGGDRALLTLTSPVNRLVRRLVRHGVVVVAAAGNRPNGPMVPPATAPEALTVGGLDDRNGLDPAGRRPWPSTHGITVDGITKPDLLAPSVWVPAPILPGTAVAREAALLMRFARATRDERRRLVESFPGVSSRILAAPAEAIDRIVGRRIRRLKLVDEHHQHVDGTSFAAPIVASCVAQIREVAPELDPHEIRDVLLRTALPLPGVPVSVQGAGALHAGAAVSFARRLARWHTAWPSPRSLADRVVFMLVHETARAVSVVGEWNAFDADASPLAPVVPGVFLGTIPKPSEGRHAYGFLVDGADLQHDPENPRWIPDGRGSRLSELVID